MNFTLPEARRERMEQLLEYLGDTSRYSKYYDGNRAEDFKKCFDIESEWCWKYADLMLRGMEKRELEYAERHHIVPCCFYGKRSCKFTDAMNMTVLTYGEHMYAHLCLTYCSREPILDKMASAFYLMVCVLGYSKAVVNDDEKFLIDACDEAERKRVMGMLPKIAALEESGRTHSWEDVEKYRKEYRKIYFMKNPTYFKDYYKKNLEYKKEYSKTYAEAHKDEKREYDKSYRDKNKEKIRKRKKEYSTTHRKQLNEKSRIYNSTPERKAKKHDNYVRNRSRELARTKSLRNKKYAEGYRYRNGKLVYIGQDAPPIKPMFKPVEQYDRMGNFIASYPSLTEAAQKTGLHPSLIGHVCSGKRKTTGGFVFRYAECEKQQEAAA